MRWTIPFEQLGLKHVPEVGGKNASLGELTRALTHRGINCPRGFALTAAAFHEHLKQGALAEHIYASLDGLDLANVAELSRLSKAIRSLIRGASLPQEIRADLILAYQELSRSYGDAETDVAVRSSATAEDLPTASFAGQHESYLNVRGQAMLLEAVRDCMASLFTERAIAYRSERGFDHRKVALSVGVQKMVRSDLGSAGVIFTLDTESGSRDVVIVTSSWGLGESVVKGRVTPDEFWVHKPTFELGYASVIKRQLGDKAVTLAYADDNSTVEHPTPPETAELASLAEKDLLTLTRWALDIERHYSDVAGKPVPVDIEWAQDGRNGELFIVQARPETVHAQRTGGLEVFRFALLQSFDQVVKAAHRRGRKVGICGQAPSDHPDFAKFLADIGIDSISVTSDALPAVCKALASSEASSSSGHPHAAE